LIERLIRSSIDQDVVVGEDGVAIAEQPIAAGIAADVVAAAVIPGQTPGSRMSRVAASRAR
jgi:hypothetical protein